VLVFCIALAVDFLNVHALIRGIGCSWRDVRILRHGFCVKAVAEGSERPSGFHAAGSQRRRWLIAGLDALFVKCGGYLVNVIFKAVRFSSMMNSNIKLDLLESTRC